MPSQVAALLCTVGILGLFILERRQKLRTSSALWIPVIYIFLVASRPVSMWLGINSMASTDQALEGSPTDRVVFGLLQGIAFVVVLSRYAKVKRLLRANAPLVLYLVYCGLSILWSDYPMVALKRWIKLTGELIMILVVLTDPNPLWALKRFLLWPAFVLVPVSVLFIKYYPYLGRNYDPWSGAQNFTGITYNKNLLGVLCLVWGVGCLWLISERLTARGDKAVLFFCSILLISMLWLLQMSNSATSMSCLLMGTFLIVASRYRAIVKRPLIIHMSTFAMVLAACSVLFLGIGTSALDAMGRDSTLTGRTELWELVLKMTDNPIFGAGYESFWLGWRLQTLWSIYWWQPTQAHNGYIEIFINLGWVGIILLTVMIVSGYHKAVSALRRREVAASLRLAYVVIAITYNFTEAAFRMQNLPWVFLLLAIIGLPEPRRKKTDGQQGIAAPQWDSGLPHSQVIHARP